MSEGITVEIAKAQGLTEEEWERILDRLGRKPNLVELGIFGANLPEEHGCGSRPAPPATGRGMYIPGWGVVLLSFGCLACERDPEAIALTAEPAFTRERPATFAVRVRRRDKTFPLTSQELEREVGAALQRATALPVELSRPDLKLLRTSHRTEGRHT